MDNYKCFTNKKCEYFPCHKGICEESFNCMFCYCPLVSADCSGVGTPVFIKTDKGIIKDCSSCIFPHRAENYNVLIKEIERRGVFLVENLKG